MEFDLQEEKKKQINTVQEKTEDTNLSQVAEQVQQTEQTGEQTTKKSSKKQTKVVINEGQVTKTNSKLGTARKKQGKTENGNDGQGSEAKAQEKDSYDDLTGESYPVSSYSEDFEKLYKKLWEVSTEGYFANMIEIVNSIKAAIPAKTTKAAISTVKADEYKLVKKVLELRQMANAYYNEHRGHRMHITGGKKKKDAAEFVLSLTEEIILNLPEGYRDMALDSIIADSSSEGFTSKRNQEMLTREAQRIYKSKYPKDETRDKKMRKGIEENVDYRYMAIIQAEKKWTLGGRSDALCKKIDGLSDMAKKAGASRYFHLFGANYYLDRDGKPLTKEDAKKEREAIELTLHIIHAREEVQPDGSKKIVQKENQSEAEKAEDIRYFVNAFVQKILSFEAKPEWADPDYAVAHYGEILSYINLCGISDDSIYCRKEYMDYFRTLPANVQEQFILRINLLTKYGVGMKEIQNMALNGNKISLDNVITDSALEKDSEDPYNFEISQAGFSKKNRAMYEEFCKKGSVKIDYDTPSYNYNDNYEAGSLNDIEIDEYYENAILNKTIHKSKKGYVKPDTDKSFATASYYMLAILQEHKEDLSKKLDLREELKKEKEQKKQLKDYRAKGDQALLKEYNEENRARIPEYTDQMYKRYMKLSTGDSTIYAKRYRGLFKLVRLGKDGLPLTEIDRINDKWNLKLFKGLANNDAKNDTVAEMISDMISELSTQLLSINAEKPEELYKKHPESFYRICGIADYVGLLDNAVNRLPKWEKEALDKAIELVKLYKDATRVKILSDTRREANGPLDIVKGSFLEGTTAKKSSSRAAGKFSEKYIDTITDLNKAIEKTEYYNHLKGFEFSTSVAETKNKAVKKVREDMANQLNPYKAYLDKDFGLIKNSNRDGFDEAYERELFGFMNGNTGRPDLVRADKQIVMAAALGDKELLTKFARTAVLNVLSAPDDIKELCRRLRDDDYYRTRFSAITLMISDLRDNKLMDHDLGFDKKLMKYYSKKTDLITFITTYYYNNMNYRGFDGNGGSISLQSQVGNENVVKTAIQSAEALEGYHLAFTDEIISTEKELNKLRDEIMKGNNEELKAYIQPKNDSSMEILPLEDDGEVLALTKAVEQKLPELAAKMEIRSFGSRMQEKFQKMAEANNSKKKAENKKSKKEKTVTVVPGAVRTVKSKKTSKKGSKADKRDSKY